MDSELSFDKIPAVLQEILLRIKRIEFVLGEITPKTDKSSTERMSVQQTAVFLDCSTSTIYAMVARRQIPHEKKGRRLYFQRSELDKWLKKDRRATMDEIRLRV